MRTLSVMAFMDLHFVVLSLFCIKHLKNLRIFYHQCLGISVLNIAATVAFGSWAPVMTKGMSVFPNNYVSTYIQHNAALVYVNRRVQEYFVTTLLLMFPIFFLGYSITAIVLRPFSFFFFPTLDREPAKQTAGHIYRDKNYSHLLHFVDDWT